MDNQHNLKSGIKLNQYKIIRVLGFGGFGITYLAEDTKSNREVVIKEYFPNELAIRNFDNSIIAKTDSEVEFHKGLQRFKEEAKTLMRFNHRSIVEILGYFEANKTAYFVMKYEGGIDLDKYMQQNPPPLSQEEIVTIIMPILEGLKEVHRYNYLHRDIKPGNILLRTNNDPVLIDFGASKIALGDVSKSVTTILTMGYAPPEQYSTDVKKQGTFTDLYSIAAVMHKMITGEVPPDAQTRVYALVSKKSDPYQPLSKRNLSAYDGYFLKAIDKALSVDTKRRPQNVQEFQKNISGVVKAHISQPTEMIGEDMVNGGYEATGLFSFKGRINRQRYLLNNLIPIIIMIVGVVFFVAISRKGSESNPEGVAALVAISMITIWISFAIQVKRWHDLNWSGWWVLIGFIPYVNIIVLIILGFVRGTEGSNRFGLDPLGAVYGSENADQAISTQTNLNNVNSVTLLGMGHNIPPIVLVPNKEVIVGRSNRADIIIDNKYISGQHLGLSLDNSGYVQVRDMASSNGTYLEGRKLEANILYDLKPGQRLLVASEDIVYML